MGEPLPEHQLDTAFDPAEILDQDFDSARRGFDRHQVRAYLAAVADALQDAQRREGDMRSRLGKAVRRAELAERQVHEAEANVQVGDDVTGVLDAAQVTADQRLAAAQRSATQLLESARADADQIRRDAEGVLDARGRDAQRSAEEIVHAAAAEADHIRTDARAQAQGIRLDATDRLQQACDHSDALIREAQEARGQILEDMERRRRQARAQVERLRVGRDRLLRSYDVVRRTLDETTGELKGSLKEAKVRGDSAARAIAAEPMATREQLEDELRDAKLIGRITTTSPSDVMQSPALPRRLAPAVPVVDLRDSVPASQRALVGPKAPATAPMLDPTPPGASNESADPIAAMMQAVEAKHGKATDDATADEEPLDPELTQLEDPDLDIVDLCDEIEEVQAVPVTPALTDLEVQRDAVIADAAVMLEQELKHALVAEQDELLAGLLSDDQIELASLVGDFDRQVSRYVTAINKVAAVTYGAGAALIDAEALEGHLPAGAVEELLAADVVLPLRERLESVDPNATDTQLDHVRAVYMQRTTDHLGFAASRLANLLCVAGLCDALPAETEIPWKSSADESATVPKLA